jgi:hypothetical protein
MLYITKLKCWDEIIAQLIETDPSARILQEEPEFCTKQVIRTCDHREAWVCFAGNIDKGFILIGNKFEWFEADSLDGLMDMFRKLFDKPGWEPQGGEIGKQTLHAV